MEKILKVSIVLSFIILGLLLSAFQGSAEGGAGLYGIIIFIPFAIISIVLLVVSLIFFMRRKDFLWVVLSGIHLILWATLIWKW